MKRLQPMLMLILAVGAAGCDEQAAALGGGGGGGAIVDSGPGLPPLPDAGARPGWPGTDAGAAPSPGAYGSPCEEDSECESEICVPDGETGVCSRLCLTDCPTFFPGRPAYCRGNAALRGSVTFVCFPGRDLTCRPCADESQCDGAECVTTADGPRCGPIPENGSCTCTEATAGTSRACEAENEHGTCAGLETCEPAEGWVGCTALEAEAELCDGKDQNCNGVPDDGILALSCVVENEHGACEGTAVCQGRDGIECLGREAEPEACDLLDNDCDGEVDEDFTDEAGRFGLFEHCGGCHRTCEDRFAFADEVACDADRDPPACIVRECAPGFQVVGNSLCVPLQDVSCTPCNSDEDCAARSPGAVCLTLGDPNEPETVARVCGRDCGPGSPYGQECPEEFACRTFIVEAGEVDQCVPAGGSCFCRDNPEGFTVPCRLRDPADPARVCDGTRSCDGVEFGECALPPEDCDGLDNDCNGVIDDGFREPESGRYALDPVHCGRCNRDCAEVEFEHADAVCDLDAPTPTCVMRCLEGFVDLENGSDDGCECGIEAEIDLPDGIDRNCDGIDGQIDRGVFVSKVGRDGAAGTIQDPLSTLQAALDLAASDLDRFRDVYVATGVYSENLTLANGISVYGGYSLDFGERDLVGNQTTILGIPPRGGQMGTVTARRITLATRLDGFTIHGVNASVSGRSSHAVFLQDSDEHLLVSNCAIHAGNGADGGRGDPGGNGARGGTGRRGQDAVDAGRQDCRLDDRAGGAGGAGACPGANVAGGNGGAAHCPLTQRNGGAQPCIPGIDDCRNSCTEAPCAPLPPAQGVGAAGAGPAGGGGGAPSHDRWSDGGVCGQCGLYPELTHRGEPGTDGPSGEAGDGGRGCQTTAGSFDGDGNWQAFPGQPGDEGIDGSGGGGGSAGSGYDTVPGSAGVCRDTVGGSGGGGGGGGCHGEGARPGSGAGGSFAVTVHFTRGGFATAPRLRGNELHRGAGGDGGSGGAGGVGGRGGLGTVGGVAVSVEAFCSEPGGRGGNGGTGGAGGGGGGSCGGNAVSIALNLSGNDLDVNAYRQGNDFVDSGRGGRGGQGGVSIGLAGRNGADGLLLDLLQR